MQDIDKSFFLPKSRILLRVLKQGYIHSKYHLLSAVPKAPPSPSTKPLKFKKTFYYATFTYKSHKVMTLFLFLIWFNYFLTRIKAPFDVHGIFYCTEMLRLVILFFSFDSGALEYDTPIFWRPIEAVAETNYSNQSS